MQNALAAFETNQTFKHQILGQQRMALRIQACPKEGITPSLESYSGDGIGTQQKPTVFYRMGRGFLAVIIHRIRLNS